MPFSQMFSSIDSLNLAALILFFSLWFKNVYNYIQSKYQIMSKRPQYNQHEQKFKQPQPNQSFISLANTHLIDIFSNKFNKKSLYNQKNSQTSKLLNVKIKVLSFFLTCLICVIIPFLIVDEREIAGLMSILRDFIKRGYFQMYQGQIRTQQFQFQHSLSLIKLENIKKALYSIVSNLIFLTLFMQNRNCQSKLMNQNPQKITQIFKSSILLMLMSIYNPFYICFWVFKKVSYIRFTKPQVKPSASIFSYMLSQVLLITIDLFIIIFTSPFSNNFTSLAYSQSFQPKANLTWIIYAHMFNRYMVVYQTLLFVLPISLAVPLALLKINYETKVLVLYFAIIFVSYEVSFFSIYVFWFIVFMSLSNFVEYKNKQLFVINKALGCVAFVGSTFFFVLYQNLVKIYFSSWKVNIGYPFVFGCIAWTLILLWLVQLIKIEHQQIGQIPYDNEQNQTLMTKIKSKLKDLLKINLWAQRGLNKGKTQ